MTNHYFGRGDRVLLRGSRRMHEKRGFVFEDRLRRTVYTKGRHYDTIYFGITKAEFDLIDPPQALWEDRRYQVNLHRAKDQR